MLLGTTYVVLQETGASKAFVERILARFIRGDFDLKGAIVNLVAGTITLEDFELFRPGSGTQTPLVQVEHVEFAVTTNPLGNVLTVEGVKLEGLTLNLDLTGELPNLFELLKIPDETEQTDPEGRTIYPPVIITDSTVYLLSVPGSQPIVFDSVNLEMIPESADSSRMRLTGSMSSSAGFDLRVEGGGDPEKGEFRVVVKAEDIPLTPELARIVQLDLEPELAAMGLDGFIESLALWLEYPSETPDGNAEPVLGAGMNANIRNLSIRIPAFPYPIRGARAVVSASTRDGGTLKFDLKREGAGGNLNVVGKLTNCLGQGDGGDNVIIDVRAKGVELLVGVDLRQAIQQQPSAWLVWQAFEPRAGRVDVDLYLTSTLEDPVPRVAMDLDLKGAALTFHGFPAEPGERKVSFPLPLTDAVGQVRLRHGVLSLENVAADVAEEAGGGRMTIDGLLVPENRDGKLMADLHIGGHEVQFTPQMRAAVEALVEDGGKIFDEYSPEGKANVTVRIRPQSDGTPSYQVQILPLGASASFHGFPYRVNEIDGLIEIDPKGVSFELTGGDGGAALSLRGRFVQSNAGVRSELWLEAKTIPANEPLREALATLSPELDSLWQYFAPSGLVDCEMSLWKGADVRAPSFDLRIDVREGTAELANFPIPLQGLQGSIFVHGTPEGRRTDISSLRGYIENGRGIEPASFLLVGEVLRSSDEESLDLTSSVRGLQLNQKLARALDHNGAFKLSTWNILKPSGSVDVILRQHRAAGADQPDQYLRVWLDDVRSDAEMLPQPATHISGAVRVINGEAFFGTSADPRFPGEEFGVLRGRMGSAEIICRAGHVLRREGATEVMLTVSADNFPVDDDLANLMKGPMRDAYLNRNMQGSMTVPELSLTFTFPEQSDEFITEIHGEILARAVRMRLGTQIESLSGALFVDKGVVGPGQGYVDGHLHDVSFRVLGHDCHGFRATFHADAEKLQIGLPSGTAGEEVPDFSMHLHGGTLVGQRGADAALQYEFRDDGVLTLDTTFNGLSLSEFLRSSGLVGSPFRGTLSGQLQISELIAADFVDMKANGSIRIADADLGAVPAFTSIYAYIAQARRPRFDSADIEFEIRDRRVRFERLDVGSPLINVSGDGTMRMDGYLDLALWVPNLLGEDADFLVLPQIVDLITSRVVQFDVYGYVRNIRVQPRWPWDATPDREPISPIPAAPKKVTRPRY